MVNNKPGVSYAVIEPNTYMVLTLPEGGTLVDYCLTMAERNSIYGLLKVHRQFIDGETRLYYEITGKKKVTDLCAGGVTEHQGLQLLRSMLRAFRELPEYFLDSGKCLLDVELIFADSSFEVGLPLLPLESTPSHSGEALKQFFIKLIGEYLNKNGTVPIFDRAVSMLIRADSAIAVLEELFGDAAPAPAAVTAPPIPGARPVAAPVAALVAAPPVPTPPAPKSEARPTPPPAAPKPAPPAEPQVVGGIAIPGMAVPVADDKKKKKEKPAKPEKEAKADKPAKEKKPGLFGLGKGKPAELDMNRQDHVVAAPAAPSPPPAAFTPPEPVQGSEWRGTAFLDTGGDARNKTMALGVDSGARGVSFTHGGRQVVIPSTPFVIGREAGQYIINSPKVSATHVTIRDQGGRYTVTDENSTNHTWLNGVLLQPYTETPLADGDVLRLANEELRFSVGG